MSYICGFRVDNNLILLLTLNVFEDEDERFMKVRDEMGMGRYECTVEPICFCFVSGHTTTLNGAHLSDW